MKEYLVSWAALTGGILVAVEAAKKALPKLVGGREKLFALGFGVVGGLAARGLGTMPFPAGWEGWALAAAGGLGAGMVSQFGHDSLLDPALKAVKALLGAFSKKKED